MGNYANWDNVTDRYPKAGSFVGSVEMQDSYIAGAEAIINAYISKRFDVPISGEPPLLQDLTVDLTYCKLAFNKDKGVPKLKESVLDMLKMIMSGELLLLDSDGEQVTDYGQATWSSEGDYNMTHSELGPLDDLIDPDRLDDLADDRS